MKVLIAGGGPFCGQLIARLNREQHEVYQILNPHAQQNEKNSSSEGNVTKYYFDLDDKSIGFIIVSIKPDAIIFAGVMSDEYDWSLNHSSSSAMLSGLSSLLCLATANQIPRFVYLSSYEVYGTKHNCLLDDQVEKKPDNIKGYVISESENICAGFSEVSALSPIVLRFSEVYGLVSEELDDFASKLFFTALHPDAERLPQLPPVNVQFSPLYVSDAVDAVYKAITVNHPIGGVYNVAGKIIDMADVYNEAEQIAGSTFTKSESDEPVILTVDGSDFVQKFGFRQIIDIASGLKRTFKAYKKERRKEIKETKKTGGFRKFLKFIAPFAENAFAFGLIVVISILSDQVPQLQSIDYMTIYVIIISIIFGLLQSSISIIFAFSYMIWKSTGQGFLSLDIVTGFDMLLRMIQILIVGMLCGYSSDNMRTRMSEKDLALADVQSELDAIYEINDRNTKIKQALDSRLTNYENSLAKIYSITDRLNSLQVDEVFFSAINAVSEIMHSNDVSIYIVTGFGNKMCRLVAKSPQSERQLRKSIPLADFGAMADCMLNDDIYVNHDLNQELPIMAAPIFSARDLVSIIMLWSVEFEDLTIYNVNNMLVLSKLISSIIEKAYVYTQATAEATRLQDTRILLPEAFNELLKVHDQAKREGFAQYSIFDVSLENGTLEEIIEKVSGMLRNTDYIGYSEDGRLQVLLTNTNQNDMQFVYDRFKKAGVSIVDVSADG